MRGMPLAETVERTGSDLSGDSGSLLGVCLAQPKRCFQSAFAGWRRLARQDHQVTDEQYRNEYNCPFVTDKRGRVEVMFTDFLSQVVTISRSGSVAKFYGKYIGEAWP